MSVAKETDKEKKPDVLIEKEVAEVGAVRFSFQYLLIPWFPDDLNISLLKKTCNFYGQIPATLMPVVDCNNYG